jgi:hypothetical protein
VTTVAAVLLAVAGGLLVTVRHDDHRTGSQGAQEATAAEDTSGVPQTVTDVPTSLPPGGVNVKGIVTLMPFSGSPALSADQAIRMNHAGALPPFHYASLLASVTVPFTLPPEGASTNKYRPIKNMPCWVVTYTLPKAINVEMVAGRPPLMVTHQVEVFSAKTGAYVVGFFTQ